MQTNFWALEKQKVHPNFSFDTHLAIALDPTPDNKSLHGSGLFETPHLFPRHNMRVLYKAVKRMNVWVLGMSGRREVGERYQCHESYTET